MSFSGDVKAELAAIEEEARHCRIAELAAMVLLAGEKTVLPGGQAGLMFRMENGYAERKLFTLLKGAFNIDVVSDPDSRHVHETAILDPEGAASVLGAVGHSAVLRRECCRRAFLRGAFLAAGSISDPEKSYHLEIVCPDEEKAGTVRSVMGDLALDPRIVLRKKSHVVYIKEGDQIVDLLGAMGASISFLNIETIRVTKEMRGNVNRRVNCETANLNKTVVTAVRQMEDICYIRDHGGFPELSPQLREMAEVRLRYPEASLAELGSCLNPAIGKSGVNHRLRKLCAFADAMRLKRAESK